MKQGLVLLAHGSRDPHWSRPFKRIASRLARRFPVGVAYLELAPPSLEAAVASLVAAGVRSVRVVPVFLGSGRHLKRDLAAKVKALRRRHKGVRIVALRAIGEQPKVIAAIAGAIAAGTPSLRGSGRRS